MNNHADSGAPVADARFADQIDAVSIEALHRTGATKWIGDGQTIGAFIAEMDFGIAPAITEALLAAVEEGSFGYMAGRQADDMARATADWCGAEYGWAVSPADVLPIADVIKGLEIAIEHLSKPGSKIIIPTPAYMPFLMFPPLLEREFIEVPLACDDGRYRFDMDALQKAFDDGGNLLILCNPYNPVGRVFSRQELLEISDLVDRNHGRVFADEIWAPLVFPGHEHIPYVSISEAAAGHAITATSASKAWNLPGLKCAQLILSNDSDRKTLRALGKFATHGAGNLGAEANTAAYDSGKAWLTQALAYLDRNRLALPDLVKAHLPGVRCTVPEGTYISWLDFRDTPVADNPAAYFQKHAGVILTEGTACGRIGKGYARFVFATPYPIMEQAFVRMGRALCEHG